MARYNHFSERKYPTICFSEIEVGKKFRTSIWKGKKVRRDVAMIKTSELTYQELRSKKEHRVLSPEFEVSMYKINDRQRKNESPAR